MSQIWLDYSGARPNPRTLKKHGVTGVLRYLSYPNSSTAWKRITKSEAHALLDAGLDLILNWEWYEGRMLEGRKAGLADGKMAMAQAKALGYPKGASIYFSHDTGVRRDRAILQYMRGVNDALKGYYVADIYSGYDVVELVKRKKLARHGWQTLAWSQGRIGSAHLYQNGRMWFNKGADENRVRHAELGSWLQTKWKNGHPNKPTAPVKHPAKPAPKPPVKATPTDAYTVKAGETLSSIAVARHTTVAELVKLNPALAKNPHMIHAGSVIRVPHVAVHAPVTPAKPAPHKPAPHKPAPKPKPKVVRHRVARGDSLSAIAKRYHTSVRQVQKWNPIIKNPNMIHVGWVLRVR